MNIMYNMNNDKCKYRIRVYNTYDAVVLVLVSYSLPYNINSYKIS